MMLLTYIPNEKSSGSPIMILNQPGNIATKKGITPMWKNHNFISGIEGIADIKMTWTKTNKSDLGKSCVLEIENYQDVKIDESKTEQKRIWYCKGMIAKGLNPIILSDNLGKNRTMTDQVVYKNVKFSLKYNNAIPKEKQSRATTILRVFEN